MWFVGFGVLTFDQFMEHLVKVYFPGPYSEADYIIGNGALACVFNERLYYEEDQEKRLELDKYKTVCDTNMEKALSGLRVQTSASFENIKALTFGVRPGYEFIEDMVVSVGQANRVIRQCVLCSQPNPLSCGH